MTDEDGESNGGDSSGSGGSSGDDSSGSKGDQTVSTDSMPQLDSSRARLNAGKSKDSDSSSSDGE